MQPIPMAANATGEPGESFTYVALRWASVRPMSGREYMRAQQPIGEVTHIVRLRWGTDIKAITAKWELWLGTVTATVEPVVGTVLTAAAKAACRVFNIVSAMNIDERNREWEILAREAV